DVDGAGVGLNRLVNGAVGPATTGCGDDPGGASSESSSALTALTRARTIAATTPQEPPWPRAVCTAMRLSSADDPLSAACATATARACSPRSGLRGGTDRSATGAALSTT